MVWMSTTQSLENREVSLLAIFEIIIAVIIYWGIAIYYNIYWHLFASIMISPLLLLRSKQSIKMGLRYFSEILERRSFLLAIDNQILGKIIVITILFALLTQKWTLSTVFLIGISHPGTYIVYAIFSKIKATLLNIVVGYKEIINNWHYSNFIIDFKQIPELIPGIEKYDGLFAYKLSTILQDINSSKSMDKFYILIVLFIYGRFASLANTLNHNSSIQS